MAIPQGASAAAQNVTWHAASFPVELSIECEYIDTISSL